MKLVTTNLLDRFWKNGVKPIMTSLGDKFDKSRIVNNMLTTVAGYALDGRLGPVIQKQIDDLLAEVSGINSNFVDTGWVRLNSAYPVFYRHKNGFVTLYAVYANIVMSSGSLHIGELPAALKPPAELTAMDAITGYTRLAVAANAKVSIITVGNGNHDYCYATLTYPV